MNHNPFAGIFMVDTPLPAHTDHPTDLSWMLIAITRNGYPLIIDGAEDFWNRDIIVNGECAIDNGVIIPKGLLNGALYRMDSIKIAGGGPDHNGEYWGLEISGEWTQLYPLSKPSLFSVQ